MIHLIEPYNPGWKAEFEFLKKVLEKELNSYDPDIQHIGSTSIPGLTAKPILDIDIILSDKLHLNEISTRLEKNKRKWQSHHLHVYYSDSLPLKNHLLFRNALLQDRNLATRYDELKKAIIKEAGMTREEYTKRKTEFIISVLRDLGMQENELSEIIQSNQ